MMAELNYESIGLVAGLEIHQQLDTQHKLFCKCPATLRAKKDSNFEFFRYLRASKSEMGEIDRAAEAEERYRRTFVYKAYDSTCLVESDEEPPHELNREALEIALEIALLLDMDIVDEVHTMRKIVIDGSNTSGFQRTALIATNGKIETEEGVVRINTLCLEEEAAQKLTEEEDCVVYSLDRLGIPLVEIGTAPDIRTPEQARKVAEHIGMILHSTGKVKRGLGTIRQDINVSIRDGARVEIKGVQNLGMIEKVIKNEVIRQLNLLKIRDELRRRNAYVEREIKDVSEIFKGTKSRVIRAAGRVFGVCLRKYGGIVGKEIQPGRRFGSELSDVAKRFGVGGIFHTDELPAYGISEEEVIKLKRAFNATDEDCVIIVAADEERAVNALNAILERAEVARYGIPEETRRALEDGNTAYMRPLPGAARMYPETDVPPIEITEDMVRRIKLPELFEDRKRRYMREYGINEELASKIARSINFKLFEKIMGMFSSGDAADRIPATLVIRTLTDTMTELMREGVPVQNIGEQHIIKMFEMLAAGDFSKEAIPEILRGLATNPEKSVEEVVTELGLKAMDIDEVKKFIERVVEERADFVRMRGLKAVNPLMGVVMKELRGKVDGKIVSEMLKNAVKRILNESV